MYLQLRIKLSSLYGKKRKMGLKSLQFKLFNVILALGFIYKIDNMKLGLESLQSNSEKKEPIPKLHASK